MSNFIRMKLKAYDHKILDKSVNQIVETARRTGVEVWGPIPMPTKINRYTVLKSPHVDKKSREQFEVRVHKRLLYVVDPNQQTLEALKKLEISTGVDIDLISEAG